MGTRSEEVVSYKDLRGNGWSHVSTGSDGQLETLDVVIVLRYRSSLDCSRVVMHREDLREYNSA